MLERIRQEFQCFKGQDQKYNVWKDKVRIPVFARVRSEFKCLEG